MTAWPLRPRRAVWSAVTLSWFGWRPWSARWRPGGGGRCGWRESPVSGESDPPMLPGLTLPASLRRLLDAFAGCFTKPTLVVFTAMVVGMIAQTGSKTVCGMLAGAGLAQTWSHDRVHRFFARLAGRRIQARNRAPLAVERTWAFGAVERPPTSGCTTATIVSMPCGLSVRLNGSTPRRPTISTSVSMPCGLSVRLNSPLTPVGPCTSGFYALRAFGAVERLHDRDPRIRSVSMPCGLSVRLNPRKRIWQPRCRGFYALRAFGAVEQARPTAAGLPEPCFYALRAFGAVEHPADPPRPGTDRFYALRAFGAVEPRRRGARGPHPHRFLCPAGFRRG